MTSTDRLAEPAASEARLMAAEISRLRTKIVGLEAIVADNEARVANTHGMAAEIERLRARITELEDQLEVRKALARNALAFALEQGSLAKPTPDEPATITHNIPPSAPPHDKPMSIIDLNIITAKALEIMSQPEPENGCEDAGRSNE